MPQSGRRSGRKARSARKDAPADRGRAEWLAALVAEAKAKAAPAPWTKVFEPAVLGLLEAEPPLADCEQAVAEDRVKRTMAEIAKKAPRGAAAAWTTASRVGFAAVWGDVVPQLEVPTWLQAPGPVPAATPRAALAAIFTPARTDSARGGLDAEQAGEVMARVAEVEARLVGQLTRGAGAGAEQRPRQHERARRSRREERSADSRSSADSGSRASSVNSRSRRRTEREMRRLQLAASERATDVASRIRSQLSVAAMRRSRRCFAWEAKAHAARVAPSYLGTVYGGSRTVLDHARRVINERDLVNAHEADAYCLAAAAIDELFVADGMQVLESSGVELLCRRCYAFERSTAEVKGLEAMKKARGQVKATYAALDVVGQLGACAIAAVDKEVDQAMRVATTRAAAQSRAAASM